VVKRSFLWRVSNVYAIFYVFLLDFLFPGEHDDILFGSSGTIVGIFIFDLYEL
jgi:hypothetical protein